MIASALLVGAAGRAALAQPVTAPPVATPATTAAAPATAPDAQLAGLDALIRDLMVKGGVPGLSGAVLRGGAVVWTRGFGVADAGSGRPVTADTVFEAASLGKPVFAYAVLRLAEREAFDLDRPLPAYLPNPDIKNDERVKGITARRVLCHTSGLPNWRRGKQLTIDSEPGERFSYSGEGYVYLQQAVEAVTGLSLDAFVRREVFQPLGMSASSYVWREAYAATAAVGHDYLQQPVAKEKPEKGNAASSLHTTAGDYARFLAEMLRPTLLGPAMAERMLKSEVEVQKDLGWGLGWGLERVDGTRFFWHWGDNDAFRSFVIGCQETGAALVMLTNSENGLAIAEPIVAAVMGGTHPAFGWLDYDRYDSPARTIRERLVRAGVANGERGVYKTLKELEGTYPRAAFTESLLNRIGYELLAKGATGAATEVLEHNVKLYPKSWNVYDSLAEAYARGGDLRQAIQYYERSLKLNPENENAKVALRKLREARSR
jgi:CubicO group peptidase (beta-lactamase class C family)